eukprot:SAG31_NODE_19143_length_611_cov_0.679688_1_plen_40_part_01
MGGQKSSIPYYLQFPKQERSTSTRDAGLFKNMLLFDQDVS